MPRSPSSPRHPFDELAPTSRRRARLSELRRNARRLFVARLRGAWRGIVRATWALLADAGADTALLLGAASTWGTPFEQRPRLAHVALPQTIEPPDLHAVITEQLYPGCPGAVVRFSAAMAGTDLMANYPWSRERGWVASN